MKKCPICGRKVPKNAGVCSCGHHFLIQREGRSRTAPAVWATFAVVVVLGIIVFGVRIVTAADDKKRAEQAQEVIKTALQPQFPDKEFRPFVSKRQEIKFTQPMDGVRVDKVRFERRSTGLHVFVDYFQVDPRAKPYVTFVFYDLYGTEVLRGYVTEPTGERADRYMEGRFLSDHLNRISIVATEPKPL